jgi:hypothetical protein
MERRSENSPPEAPLKFKPLSEGLGFHPFSDGLPYAPISQAGKTLGAAPTTLRPSSPYGTSTGGTGAVAAGPARPVLPEALKPLPRIPSLPSAAPSAGPRHTSLPVQTRPAAPSLTAGPAPLPASAPVPTHESPLLLTEKPLGFVYFLQRSLAWSLDTAIHLTLGGATLVASLEAQGIALDSVLRSDAWIAAAVFLLGFSWALILAQEVAFGTTLGKRLFKLEIEGSPASLFVRAFFFVPSQLLFGLGLLWGLFDSKKRCWHDRVADSQPLPVKRY